MVKIQKNISLKEYTTFKIGGEAKFFAKISSEEELQEALNYARNNSLEVFVLGGGSNILVSGNGFNGLVIRMQNVKYRILGTSIECGAGLPLTEAVKLAKENSLVGLEWAAGIPGTVGGAVRGNAGAYGSDMSEIIESAKVIEIYGSSNAFNKIFNFQFSILNQFSSSKFSIKKYEKKDCGFDYRGSIFKRNKKLIILSCMLKLKKGDKAEIENKIRDIIGKRNEKIPAQSSAGSFFENPVVIDKNLIEQFEKDTGAKSSNGKIPAGWLIEEVGLRGKKIGGVMVSEKHANFIINSNQGKAEDIITLASLIKMKVRNELGVQLKEEVQYIGF